MPTQWLTPRQVSNRLNLHVSTVYRHLHAGTFPCRSLRIGRAWRIDAAQVDSLKRDLQELLANGDTAATASVLTALIESGE
jgi:excisionase family DNA binding protein